MNWFRTVRGLTELTPFQAHHGSTRCRLPRRLPRLRSSVLFLCSNNLKFTTMAPRIKVTPASALVDDKVATVITGLEPGSTVTIRAQMQERKMRFESHAHYIADLDGKVDFNERPSVGGSYVGNNSAQRIEPMGLFWSMLQSPGQRQGLRFAKLDVDSPIDVNLSLHKGFQDIATINNSVPMANTGIERWYKADNVERIPVRFGKVRGMMLKPKGKGPFPGVIDMFGSVGGLLQFRSALLASRGFAAFTLPFFGYEDLPTSTWDIDMEYFQDAAEWLSRQPYVIPGGVGVLGVSLGGQIALTMASYFPETIKAVVSISSPCANLFPSFRYKGEYLPPLRYDPARKVEGEHGMITGVCPDDIRTTPENTIIPIEKSQNLLFLVGHADVNWPSLLHAQEAIKRLKSHGHRNHELVSYPGAGHLIEPPYSPFCRCSFHRDFGYLLDWGGNMIDHARAQEDAWPRTLQFLRKHLREAKSKL
ncbi:acyl-coenzyme A amino acid N-acyltransferase 1-like [Amphiura filiformis]|uniref:acyl-coenzyme A amino acid N-acyltransferase 1-like n=1 Tax=Amphiura filiformis TaxID=82378 RepID=UPI003B21E117